MIPIEMFRINQFFLTLNLKLAVICNILFMATVTVFACLMFIGALFQMLAPSFTELFFCLVCSAFFFHLSPRSWYYCYCIVFVIHVRGPQLIFILKFFVNLTIVVLINNQ